MLKLSVQLVQSWQQKRKKQPVKRGCVSENTHIDLPRHGMVSGYRCFLEKDLTSFMIKLMFKPEAFTFALI